MALAKDRGRVGRKVLSYHRQIPVSHGNLLWARPTQPYFDSSLDEFEIKAGVTKQIRLIPAGAVDDEE